MRSGFLVLFSCLLIPPLFSQIPQKDEIDGAMQEVANEIKKEIASLEEQIDAAKKDNPEEVGNLVDQLNMMKTQLATMESLTKSVQSMSDETMEQASEHESTQEGKNRNPPERDEKRLKAIPDKIPTDAELLEHIKKVHSEVERLLPRKYQEDALRAYGASKDKNKSSDYMGNVASSLWMVGDPELALLTLGIECIADPKNYNNLNNYAAFLTMANGEHAAVPILLNLNQKFPNNSTILNNLAQAYYGLGDTNNAKKHLDQAIRIYARHVQANLTKSAIERSEGKTKEAIQSIKQSVKEHYTAEKEALLDELGGTLEYDDVSFPYQLKAEPLGFEKFILIKPEYPFEGGTPAEALIKQWDDYREKLHSLDNRLREEMTALKSKADAYNARMLANPMLLKPYMSSPVYRTAERKIALLVEWFSEQRARIEKQIRKSTDDVELWRKEYWNTIAAIQEANRNADETVVCNKVISATTAFLTKANTVWQQRNSEFLTLQKQYLNTRANLTLYVSTDRSLYQYMIAEIQRTFVEELANLNVELESGCIPEEIPPQGLRQPLPDFDELNCEYKDEYFIPPFTTIKTECNKMSTTFDVDTELGVKVKVGWEEDLNHDKITKGTLEFGVAKSIGGGSLGPFAAETSGSGAVGVEITENGIKEVYIKAGVSAGVGGNVEGGFMDSKSSSVANVELKSSWNAGSNEKGGSIVTGASGSALLNNISLTPP